MTVIATGFGGGRPRRRRTEACRGDYGVRRARTPSFDPRPREDETEIDVPSFLRD